MGAQKKGERVHWLDFDLILNAVTLFCVMDGTFVIIRDYRTGPCIGGVRTTNAALCSGLKEGLLHFKNGKPVDN